jgi:translation initiation factor 2 gamma subunit (eIF-2gamma)
MSWQKEIKEYCDTTANLELLALNYKQEKRSFDILIRAITENKIQLISITEIDYDYRIKKTKEYTCKIMEKSEKEVIEISSNVFYNLEKIIEWLNNTFPYRIMNLF